MDSCKLATCYYWWFSGSTTDSSDVINRWSFGLVLAVHHLLVEICVLVLLLMSFSIFLEQFDCLNSKFKMSIHVVKPVYKGHSRELENVPLMGIFPLYRC